MNEADQEMLQMDGQLELSPGLRAGIPVRQTKQMTDLRQHQQQQILLPFLAPSLTF